MFFKKGGIVPKACNNCMKNLMNYIAEIELEKNQYKNALLLLKGYSCWCAADEPSFFEHTDNCKLIQNVLGVKID